MTKTNDSERIAGDTSLEIWAEIERLCRKVNPNMPDDLTDYEVRVLMNHEFNCVEVERIVPAIGEQAQPACYGGYVRSSDTPCSVCGAKPTDQCRAKFSGPTI